VSSATSAEQLPLYRPILAASFYSPVFGGRIGCATAPFRRLPFTHGVREWQQRVDTSSSPDGEAAVRPRLTLERQVTSRLLPDFTYQATGSSGRLAGVDRPTGFRVDLTLE